MNNLTCVVCHKPLSGGTDTFGDIHTPVCQQCHLELWAEAQAVDREETERRQKRKALLLSEMEALRSEIRYVENKIEILVTVEKNA